MPGWIFLHKIRFCSCCLDHAFFSSYKILVVGRFPWFVIYLTDGGIINQMFPDPAPGK
jgi:hypothetical protein